MRLAEISKQPARRLPRTPSGEALAKAEQSGFDISRLWFHGTRKRFDGFRLPKTDGIDELGPGVYLTSEKWLANTWARQRGFIVICVIRKGNLFDLDTLWTDKAKTLALLHKGYAKAHLERWGKEISDVAADFDDRYERLGKRLINHCLAALGYVGAFKKDSQIPGQVVIFKPSDVMIIARQGGKDHMDDD